MAYNNSAYKQKVYLFGVAERDQYILVVDFGIKNRYKTLDIIAQTGLQKIIGLNMINEVIDLLFIK